MAEKVLNKALGGKEIQEAVIARLREAFRNDCRLNPIMAYGAYRLKLRVDIEFQDAGSGNTKTAEEFGLAEGEFDPEREIEKDVIEAIEEPRFPNIVRRDSDQLVPVLTQDAKGRPVEKGVSYRKPGFVTGREK